MLKIGLIDGTTVKELGKLPVHGPSNGLLRRQIAKVGAAYGGRIISIRRITADDACIRGLLLSGRITQEYLESALKGYNLFPGSFAWLRNIDDPVLYRADVVFLAKYGREPVRHSDFRENGHYHEICRNLTNDWNCYSTDLEELICDSGEQGHCSDAAECSGPPSVELIRVSGITIWAVLGVIVLGLLAFYGANRSGDWNLMMVSAAGLFVATVASIFVFPPYRCPRCRTKYGASIPAACEHCGIRFRSAEKASSMQDGNPC